MAYEDFKGRFKEVRSQHNIMALVGNGFDIQALSGVGSPTDTRYESFYHYLRYRKFDATNLILERMEALRNDGLENWSDVENAIESLRTVDLVCPERISGDVRKIQREFANFLDQVATPDVLSRLGEDAVSQKKTMVSFTEFLGDIEDPEEYNKLRLIKKLNIGDVFNFKFVNFNYTTLLDDFVYLDQRAVRSASSQVVRQEHLLSSKSPRPPRWTRGFRIPHGRVLGVGRSPSARNSIHTEIAIVWYRRGGRGRAEVVEAVLGTEQGQVRGPVLHD